jgi:hypothetical protein
MTKKSLNWSEHFQKHRAGYEEIANWDPFKNWERNYMADGAVEDGLRHGLIALYASDKALAGKFLQQSLALFQRAMKDRKFRPEGPGSGYPRNLAQAIRAQFYASALLGKRCDFKQLEEASEHYQTWCRGYRKGDWNAQSEAYYLNAVRLYLIASNRDKAAELLGARKIKWHGDEAENLKRLAGGEDLGEADAERFDSLFLPLCSPRYFHNVFFELEIVRLELSVLRYQYFSASPGTIDWDRVIAQIVEAGSSH